MCKKYKILTIRFDPNKDSFETEALRRQQQEKEIEVLQSELICVDGKYYWTLFISYDEEFSKETHTALCNSELYNCVRNWRNKMAEQEGIPPYLVLPNSVMEKVVMTLPLTATSLKQLHGIGEKKYKKYGASLLELIQTHIEKVENAGHNR